jgi:hypothetical protein
LLVDVYQNVFHSSVQNNIYQFRGFFVFW